MSEFPVTSYTPTGWPQLTQGDYLRAIPTYTAELAAKLDAAGPEAGNALAAAINAQHAAEAAAAVAARVPTLVRLSSNVILGQGAQIGNLAATIRSPGPAARWRATAHLDATIPADKLAVIALQVGGVAQPGELFAQVTGRFPIHNIWTFSGLAAGTHTVRLIATPTTSPGAIGAAANHSWLQLERIA